MLTDYQYKVMADQYFNNKPGENGGQTKTHSLEDARDFCNRAKLTDKDAMIIEDNRTGVFFIEAQDNCSMIRNFETTYPIKEKRGKAKTA